MINPLKFKSLLHLLDYFKDETVCRHELALARWNGKPTCPHCESEKVYTTKRGFKCADKNCSKSFTVTVGSIFENSKIPLRTWYAAIYLITAHKKGISSCQLARDLNVTQKTAWFLLHRIRETLQAEAPQVLKEVVEVDATYVGGKAKNMHKKKREAVTDTFGRGTGHKTAVIGLLQREGEVRAFRVDSEAGKVVTPIINEMVEKGATVITDAHAGYKNVGKAFTHIVVNHQGGTYTVGKYHTNNIEGVWAILKRSIIGIYHQVSPKHLNRYCVEVCYRYNSREITDCDRFSKVLTHTEHRLRYKDLIAA